MNKEEAVEIIARSIPEKDAYIVLDIVKKTIEDMNFQPSISDEDFLAFTPQERYIEMITPRICSFKFSDEVSCIFIRFVGDETPLANVLFFPIEAVWSFLDTARNYYNTPGTTLTEEEIEKFSFNKAIMMFCIMLRNLYPRVMATMVSITEETINEWYRQEDEDFREYCYRQGVVVPTNEANIKRDRRNIINEYKKGISNVWERERKNFGNYQKLRFAEEYEKLYKHWDTISLLYRNKKDFLVYAKMEEFQDTPDDLLDELKGSHHRGISSKALEHAARRIRLVNLDNKDEKVLEKRRNGIPASGFSEAALYKYLEDGRKLIEQLKNQQSLETTPPKSQSVGQ